MTTKTAVNEGFCSLATTSSLIHTLFCLIPTSQKLSIGMAKYWGEGIRSYTRLRTGQLLFQSQKEPSFPRRGTSKTTKESLSCLTHTQKRRKRGQQERFFAPRRRSLQEPNTSSADYWLLQFYYLGNAKCSSSPQSFYLLRKSKQEC